MPSAPRPRWPLFLLSVIATFTFGCSDDDPARPEEGPNPAWLEVRLPDGLPRGMLWGIDFHGDRGLALELKSDGTSVLLETEGGDWMVTSVPELETGAVLDVAFDQDGRGVMVGYSIPGVPRPLVLAERPEWTSVLPSQSAVAGFVAVTVDDASTFLATGQQRNEVLAWTGTTEGKWTQIQIETPGNPNDKALRDVAYGADTWVACGFDDGGDGSIEEPNAILMIDEGTGWQLVGSPCGGCGNHDYRAVAIGSTGTIYLGGSVTDFSNGGGDDYVAFLRAYERDIEEWTEIALPDPGNLDGVNDILLDSNGDIYLACGEERGAVVRLPAGSSSVDPTNVEWLSEESRFFALGQAADGTVHAVGARTSGAEPEPLMLRRP